MAKVMNFKDDRDNDYESSYWIPVQVNFSPIDKTAHIVFYGYKNKGARNSGKASVGSKSYSLSGDDFDNYFGKSEITKPNNDVLKIAYKLATDKKEGPAPREGEEDNRKSFFDGATDD